MNFKKCIIIERKNVIQTFNYQKKKKNAQTKGVQHKSMEKAPLGQFTALPTMRSKRYFQDTKTTKSLDL